MVLVVWRAIRFSLLLKLLNLVGKALCGSEYVLVQVSQSVVGVNLVRVQLGEVVLSKQPVARKRRASWHCGCLTRSIRAGQVTHFRR